jgi:Sulfatase
VLEDAPDFFVARGNTSGDIVLFALVFVLLPPTLLALVELALRRFPAVAGAVHLVFVGVLFAAFAIQILDDAIGGPSALLILLAALAGAGAVWAYARTRAVPSILTVLGPAPLVFLFIFLVTSPVSKLVFPDDGGQAAGATVSRNAPVVMVVFDEFDSNMLRDARGGIDRSRYPNFAALADDGTWYRNATTVNSQTTFAVPALMSGRRPTSKMVPVTSDYPNSLPTLLAGSHELNVTETATNLCPARLCGKRKRQATPKRLRSLAEDLGIVSLHLVAPSGLEHRLPAVDRTFGNFAGGNADSKTTKSKQPLDVPMSALTNRQATFDSLLRGIHRQDGKPTFSFLHIALPHIPWQYLPGGQEYVNGGPDYPGMTDAWSKNSVTAELGMQRHLLQAGYADHLLGRLLARLRSTGIYRRALIVVTADHGVSYRPGLPRRSPVEGTGSDIASVPLVIKYPGRERGRVDDSFARTIDVVPTIADALGAKLPYHPDGRSVMDGGPASGEVTVDRGPTGTSFSEPFDQFVREKQAGLRRMVRLFGSDDGGRRLYALGPNSDLLGRSATRLQQVAATGGRVELDSRSLLDHFRPGERLVPSFMSAQIAGGVPAGAPLAVAVNGTIRSVTQTFVDQGQMRMAAIAPADAFSAGSNSVDVFAVRGSGSRRALAPLTTGQGEQFRLVQSGGATALEAGSRRIEVSKGNLQGYVDQFLHDDQGVRLGGWAVDDHGNKPVKRILVFAGDRLVAEGAPSVERPDVAKNLGGQAKMSGFGLRVPLQGVDPSQLSVFALSGGEAAKLQRWKG